MPDPAKRTRRPAALLRRLVLDAAAAEFEARGFAGATTAAIARRAAVTEAQLFRLFPSKQALFRAAVFEPLEEQLASFSAPSGAVADRHVPAAAYTDALYTFLAKRSGMLMSLLAADAHAKDGAEQRADGTALRGYFARGAATMAERLGAADRCQAELMVRVSFAAVLGAAVFDSWLFDGITASPEQIRDALTAFVVRGTDAS